MQEITEEEEAVQVNEVIEQPVIENNINLPENIEKLVSFMNEVPGSTIEDYVRLNADYSGVSEQVLLKEYYAKTKPHLDSEDINIILEDFSLTNNLLKVVNDLAPEFRIS